MQDVTADHERVIHLSITAKWHAPPPSVRFSGLVFLTVPRTLCCLDFAKSCLNLAIEGKAQKFRWDLQSNILETEWALLISRPYCTLYYCTVM